MGKELRETYEREAERIKAMDDAEAAFRAATALAAECGELETDANTLRALQALRVSVVRGVVIRDLAGILQLSSTQAFNLLARARREQDGRG